MIVCPSCQHKQMVGAIFCGECGNSLVLVENGIPVGYLHTMEARPTPTRKASRTPPFSAPSLLEGTVSLKVVNSGELIQVSGQEEITLGRASKGQPIIPDIDLTPHQAYEAGVSRLHASIKMKNRKMVVQDLGSANGTFLNGKKIPPHAPHEIHNGDEITLGKLKMQVLIQTQNAGG